MKIFFRYLLKKSFSQLARAAIRKHSIEFIVVAGWYGTPLIREGTYYLLSEDRTVRRNTSKTWWDLSLPLLILGYKDSQRTFFNWIKLFFRIFSTLLFSPRNPHTIVIDVNLADVNTATYWASFIAPSGIIITSYKDRESILLDLLIAKTETIGGFVLRDGAIEQTHLSHYTSYTYNSDKSAIVVGKQSVPLSFVNILAFLEPVFPALVATGIEFGYTAEEITQQLYKYVGQEEISHTILKNIKLQDE
jgi:hypothetical protein